MPEIQFPGEETEFFKCSKCNEIFKSNYIDVKRINVRESDKVVQEFLCQNCWAEIEAEHGSI